jgi:hypothetical protein
MQQQQVRMLTEMLESYEREVASLEGSIKEAEEDLENTRWAQKGGLQHLPNVIVMWQALNVMLLVGTACVHAWRSARHFCVHMLCTHTFSVWALGQVLPSLLQVCLCTVLWTIPPVPPPPPLSLHTHSSQYHMQLDSSRNHIIMVNLWLSMLNISVMATTILPAFFGMNLGSGLSEGSPEHFYLVG